MSYQTASRLPCRLTGTWPARIFPKCSGRRRKDCRPYPTKLRSGDLAQSHGHAPPPEGVTERPEAPGDRGLALRAPGLGAHAAIGDLVPVAHDERRLAARAVGGAALAVVHVAGVD